MFPGVKKRNLKIHITNKKKIDWISLEQHIASLGESINTYDENMEEKIKFIGKEKG